MILSIDGATQEHYARYRQNGDLRLVYRNIEALVKAKASLGKKTPVICWQFLVFTHNVHELPLAAQIARDLGVDELKITNPFDVSWDDPQLRAAEIAPETLQFNPHTERDMGENWNVFSDDLAAEAIEKEYDATWAATGEVPEREVPREDGPGKTCHWLYKNVTMDAHGRIFPCAGAPKQGATFIFSDLDSTPEGEEPFNSRKHQRARSFFAKRTSPANGTSGAPDPVPTESREEPYCVNCDWFEDQGKTDIDTAQAEQYLRGAWPDLFSRPSRDIVCGW